MTSTLYEVMFDRSALNEVMPLLISAGLASDSALGALPK